jgi:hypothetical protein
MNISKQPNKKELLLTSAVILLCLVLFSFFPTKGNFQEIIASATFLVFLPILYIKIILKKKLSEFGIQAGNWKKGLIWGVVSLFFVIGLIFVMSKVDHVSKDYRELFYVRAFFSLFVVREISLGISFMLIDFFFRGFVMLYIASILPIKYLSILFQFALFAVFTLLLAKLTWISGVYIFLSFFAGIIAYKSKSIIYSSLFLWISIIVIELSVIKLFFSN